MGEDALAKKRKFRENLAQKVKEQKAMIKLLEDNINKLNNDVRVAYDTKQKLKELQRENNRMKIRLDDKNMELMDLQTILDDDAQKSKDKDSMDFSHLY